MTDLGIIKIGVSLAAMVSSLMGPNVVDVIVKKFGLTKNMVIVVSDQQLGFPDLNIRERNAMLYVKENGKISNRVYQKINQTTHDIARNDLEYLLRKGKLKRIGKNKSTYYILA